MYPIPLTPPLALTLIMSEKKAFVLRIQAETLKELERWAQEEFRSVNGQIEFILSDALRKRKRQQSGQGTKKSADESTLGNA